MSKCCKAPVEIDKHGIWCSVCNHPCEIDYDGEYVIKRREGNEFLLHLKCGNVTLDKNDILNKRCSVCREYLK